MIDFCSLSAILLRRRSAGGAALWGATCWHVILRVTSFYPPRDVTHSLTWRHPLSCDVILPHMTSFSFMWRHSPSCDVIFYLKWRHFPPHVTTFPPSHDVILLPWRHSPSRDVTFPPSSDVTFPQACVMLLSCDVMLCLAWTPHVRYLAWFYSRTLNLNNQGLLLAVWNQVFFILQYF